MQALKLVKTSDLSRDDWLEVRRTGIGGSDISAICGLNPWRSKMAVYLDKIHAVEDQEQNEAMYWGTLLEDVVAQEFKKRNTLKVTRINHVLQHPKYSFFLANIDRYLPQIKAILEIKTTRSESEWGEEKAPDHAVMQVVWYLGICGFSLGYLAALIAGQKYIQTEVPFDAELWEMMVKEALEFWQLVQDRTPPPMDGSDSSTDVLKLLYPTEQPGKLVELPEVAELWVRQIDKADTLGKEAKTLKAEAQNQLKNLLGDAEAGRIGDYTVTWKTVNKKEYMVAASSSRQLRIKGGK